MFLNHRAQLILVAKATILCRNDFLKVNIIDSYVCMGGVDETSLLIPLYVSFWKKVFFLFRMGAKIFVSHTFYVRNKYLRTYPKPSPAFRMVRLWVLVFFSYVFFTLSSFIIITLSLNRWESLRRSFPALISGDHGASPPPVQNQAKTRWLLGGSEKKWYRRVAWVSARRIEPSEQKKHDEIALKTHLLSPGAPSRCT